MQYTVNITTFEHLLFVLSVRSIISEQLIIGSCIGGHFSLLKRLAKVEKLQADLESRGLGTGCILKR